MRSLERSLRTLLPVAALLAGLAAAPPARGTLEIVEPREVLERWGIVRGDRTWIAVDGYEWELVTDPASPLVSQLGDGSFHPMDPATVRDAVRAVGPLIVPEDSRILVLPYPRTAPVESSCEGHLVLLSPGIREVSTEHVHATVAHELGHLVQHARIPESGPLWREYLEIRGLLGDPRYHDGAVHRDRPAEIFAEDFRWFRGGLLANHSGTIENPDLLRPDRVPGLEAWFRRVLSRPEVARIHETAPVSLPNPFDGKTAAWMEIRFTAPGAPVAGAVADVHDVTGRRVRELTGGRSGDRSLAFRWDGRNASGRPVATGIYFVRWRGHPEAGTARVHVLR